MLNKVTSKKADNSVVNEVFRQFNDWGQLAREYQSHDDVVNTSTTPHVDYGYADGSGNTIRATSMTYPNIRVLTYGYNSGNDDALGRVSYLADSGGTHLVDYSYLGLNLITGTANVQPGIMLSCLAPSVRTMPAASAVDAIFGDAESRVFVASNPGDGTCYAGFGRLTSVLRDMNMERWRFVDDLIERQGMGWIPVPQQQKTVARSSKERVLLWPDILL